MSRVLESALALFLALPIALPTLAAADSSGARIVDRQTPKVVMKDSEILLGSPIYFKKNRARVRHDYRPILQELAEFLHRHPEIRLVRVSGHADSSGPPEWNHQLAQARAQAVVAFLVNEGVDPMRLETEVLGASQPWEHEEDETGCASNRRVVFQVLQLKGDGFSAPNPYMHAVPQKRREYHRGVVAPPAPTSEEAPAPEPARPGRAYHREPRLDRMALE